jgi:hypothetical protein
VLIDTPGLEVGSLVLTSTLTSGGDSEQAATSSPDARAKAIRLMITLPESPDRRLSA